MNIILEFGQAKIITLTPRLKDGTEVALSGTPNWNHISGDSATLSPSGDGFSAVVQASQSTGGRTITAVSANAGREVIGEIITVNVVAKEAVTLDPRVA